MFNIARSRLALPVGFLLSVLNCIGVLFGILYNTKTPDLYTNNAHHSIGWIATSILTVQSLMTLSFRHSRKYKRASTGTVETNPLLKNLPVSADQEAVHQSIEKGEPSTPVQFGKRHFKSRTVRGVPSSISRNHDGLYEFESDDQESDREYDIGQKNPWSIWRQVFRRNGLGATFFSRNTRQGSRGLLSKKTRQVLEIFYQVIIRTIIVLSFIALATGGVTYTGIFVSHTDLLLIM